MLINYYAEILKDRLASILKYFMARSLSWFKQIYNLNYETPFDKLQKVTELVSYTVIPFYSLFNIINIDTKRRGEMLTLEEFAVLSRELKKLKGDC